MLKIFCAQKFHHILFLWAEPAMKINKDHTLCVTLRMSTMGTATMDTHRRLEKKRKRQGPLIQNGPTKRLSESALDHRSNIGSYRD